MKLLSQKEINQKRNNLKNQVADLINKYKISITWGEILEIIKNETGQEKLDYLIQLFAKAEAIDQINHDISLITDTWNYFPHKSLGGLSPIEKTIQYQKSK